MCLPGTDLRRRRPADGRSASERSDAEALQKIGTAAHNLQLDHPDETLAAVRELIARTRLAA
jgi:pimeloyl-ACP methyl ester carboxylesterase